MKYNFKNCRVVINAGTEVLKIGGIDEPRPQHLESVNHGALRPGEFGA